MTQHHILELKDGARIAYDQAGSGPPVLLIHGMTEDRHAWDELAPALVKEFTVIRIDLPSHGQSSDLPGVDAAGLTSMVSEFLQRLHVTSPHVVGHSLGGLIASMLAAFGRPLSVTNVDLPFFMGKWIPTARRLEHRLRDDDFTKALIEWMDEIGGSQLPRTVREELCRYRTNTLQHLALTHFAMLFRRTETEESVAASFESVLTRVRCPYLALLGSDPGSGYSSWLTRLAPSARVEIWDGMGHWLHRVDPDRFAARVVGFLADVGAKAGA